MKKKQNIVDAVFKIAQNNPSGFTIDSELNPITNGYAVATKHTQNSFGLSGCAHAVAIAFYQQLERFDAVGGWLNAQNGQYYFDAVKVFKTEAEANQYAIENNQIAYYDLSNGREIKTSYGAVAVNKWSARLF